MPPPKLQKPVLFALPVGSWPFYKNHLLRFLFPDCTLKGFFLIWDFKIMFMLLYDASLLFLFIFCKHSYCFQRGRRRWAGSILLWLNRTCQGRSWLWGGTSLQGQSTWSWRLAWRRVLCFLVLWAAYVSLRRFHLNTLKRTSDLPLRTCSII